MPWVDFVLPRVKFVLPWVNSILPWVYFVLSWNLWATVVAHLYAKTKNAIDIYICLSPSDVFFLWRRKSENCDQRIFPRAPVFILHQPLNWRDLKNRTSLGARDYFMNYFILTLINFVLTFQPCTSIGLLACRDFVHIWTSSCHYTVTQRFWIVWTSSHVITHEKLEMKKVDVVLIHFVTIMYTLYVPSVSADCAYFVLLPL